MLFLILYPYFIISEQGFKMPAFDSFCLWSFSGYVWHTTQKTRGAKIKVPKEKPSTNECTNIPAPLPLGRGNSEVLVLCLFSEFTIKIKLQLPTAVACLIMHLTLGLFPLLSPFHIPCQFPELLVKLWTFEYLPWDMLPLELKTKIPV